MLRNASRAVVTAAIALALAAPAASAALPSGAVTKADWDVRHSWINYVTNPSWGTGPAQGTVQRTGGATTQSAYGTTAWGSGNTNYDYGTRFNAASDSTASGTRTVKLTGALRFAMTLHSIDVRLSDLKVVSSGGAEKIVADAYYKPLVGSAVTKNDFDFATLATSGGVANTLLLTSEGAEVFNGGSNGSYAPGSEFGKLVYNP